MFCAGLLFDTQALLQLGWLCARGRCGLSGRLVALGVAALVALPLLARVARRALPSRPAKGGRRAAAKPGTRPRQPARRDAWPPRPPAPAGCRGVALSVVRPDRPPPR